MTDAASEKSDGQDLSVHVRTFVRDTIVKRFEGATRIEFSMLEAAGAVWKVEGTCSIPAGSYAGGMVAETDQPYDFGGTVTVGPGSTPEKTAFHVSLQLTAGIHSAFPGFTGGGPLTSSHERTPNDQRSDVFNPTSAEHRAAADNRSNQMNPNNPAYHRSRGRK